jgi:hypothetical protein
MGRSATAPPKNKEEKLCNTQVCARYTMQSPPWDNELTALSKDDTVNFQNF